METLAKPVADFAIENIKEMIRKYIGEQYQYQTTDVNAKLQQLNTSLTKIQAVVATAQNIGIKEPSYLEWLSRLRDAFYDAQYVMDVFEYRRLEEEIESWSPPMAINKGRKKRKVLDRLKFPFVKRLIFADEELNDLLEVVKKFDILVAETRDLTRLLKLHQTNQNLVNQLAYSSTSQGQAMQETTSVPNESMLFGRNEAEEQLRKLLLQSSDESEATFSVLSIVGVGGVGKSALAQSVFNHPEVKDYFKVSAWVSVSINFKINDLMLGIIEAAGIKRPTDLYNLIRREGILAVLHEGLRSKRFLIVLDDVWEDMLYKWEEISKVFQCGEQGSKIIVTSRMHKVGVDMGVQAKMMIKLNPLNTDDFWALFKKCAFGNKTPETYPKFKRIGEQIAHQLGGLPLAAKMVGATLLKNFSIERWKNILMSKMWKEEGNRIMSALKLSYDHLPIHLKKCFVYCCLFPKNFRYEERNLIDLWIALDCVKSTDLENKRLIDIQREYIDELVSRCFLEKMEMDVLGSTSYIIHDLLHDLAEDTVDGKEVYRIEDVESLTKPIPHNVRHLYLKVDSDASMNMVLQKFAPKQLRSLIIDAQKIQMQMSEESKGNLRALRYLYLYLHANRDEDLVISDSLGDLLHLRCINVSACAIVLPASFSKLYQLKTLRWRDRVTRVKLLSYIGKLINLRHVDSTIRAYDGRDILTSDLGRLKSLEAVPNGQYRVDGEEGNDISQLGELDKIGGSLELLVCVKLSKTEIRKVNLNRKKYLTKLSIIDKEGGIDDQAIEALQPHENLEILEISGCINIKKALTWLPTVSNLEILELKELPNMQGIPPDIGHLLFLQHLKLSKLPLVRHIDAPRNGGGVLDSVTFPSLISVEMVDMENLEGWSLPLLNSCSKTYFPKLSSVVINKCPKFVKMGESPNHGIPFPFPWINYSIILLLDPHSNYYMNEEETRLIYLCVDEWPFLGEYHHFHPTILEKLSSIVSLTIHSCYQLQCLPASLQALSSLETLQIKFCDQLELVDDKVDTHHLPSSIKRLDITRCCNKMKCLPESLQTLSSLEILKIQSCNGLESLGSAINAHHYFPPSIKELDIYSCHNLKFLFASSLQTLSSLEVLRIRLCSNLESLVNSVDDHHAHFPASIKKIVLEECCKLKIPPASFQMLSSLETLIIEECNELKDLLTGEQDQPNVHQMRALFPNVKEFNLIYWHNGDRGELKWKN